MGLAQHQDMSQIGGMGDSQVRAAPETGEYRFRRHGARFSDVVSVMRSRYRVHSYSEPT